MTKKSRALDGDWQGDGWGISWCEDEEWKAYKSLKPLWEDRKVFATFPKTNMFLIHARSASFPKDKNNIEYNQPYVYKNFSFVFNGLLKGVHLSVPGRIGAEKIWGILKKYLNQFSPEEALQKTADLLIKNTQQVNALNIGLSDGKKLYSFCYYTMHPEYYNLQISKNEGSTIVCSEKIGGNNFEDLAVEKVVQI
ncbi:class II glutamine amidotransferase [Candidatus Daviesbacteria bacterium]|nr:class II glutamine amidotransferase [Candidatus Daviesbacteria bacterium]